jgi:hypothetical protein
MNFKDEDPTYAEKNLEYAKALFEFAERCGTKSCNDDGPKGYYASSNGRMIIAGLQHGFI